MTLKTNGPEPRLSEGWFEVVPHPDCEMAWDRGGVGGAGEALQTWVQGSRWAPPWGLRKKKYSWHLLETVRKTLFKREVLRWGFAVGRGIGFNSEYKDTWRFIARSRAGGVSGWQVAKKRGHQGQGCLAGPTQQDSC